MKTSGLYSASFILAVSIFLINGCKKDDPTPAKPQTGQAIFWVASGTLGGSFINISVDGVSAGQINKFSTTSPSCGVSGFVTVTKAPGTYNWNGVGQDKSTWSGTVTITANQCFKVELTSSTVGGSSGLGGTVATVTAPNTFFLANQCLSMSTLGEWWVNGFTINSTSTFIFRFSSRYKADAAIVDNSQIDNFKQNKAFTGYGGFDDKFGYTTITLSAGSYYLAIRNQISTSNVVSVEFDYPITLPSSDRATFLDYYVNGVESLNAGAKLWQGFTIQKGFRYFADGCNTGLETYVIQASELDNFKNNQSFKYLVDYSGNGCEQPGLDEYKLPEGDYYLVFRNTQSVPNAVNYLLERWRVN
ncbi:MAG: hypothetical protein K2U26_19915 [Cyclobacteriaceae bacterium]|nr:hypothetical protein [Cyclobacteriaceae bacterium]